MLSIGATVNFVNEYGELKGGILTEVLSDSYDDVRLEDGGVEYWSKKTKNMFLSEQNTKILYFLRLKP